MVWSKKRVSYVFMLGFFAGILYMNIAAKDDFLSEGFVCDFFAEGLREKSFGGEYLYDIAYVRLCPCIVLFLLYGTRVRKISALTFMIWTGFLVGFLLSGAVLRMGMAGFVLSIISLLPHMIFYAASYYMILVRMLEDRRGRWKPGQVSACVILLLTGILLEYYMSPMLIHVLVEGG